MLSTYEIIETEVEEAPDLFKFNQRCKETIMDAYKLSDDECEVKFQTSNAFDRNKGYVVGCCVMAPSIHKIFYFVDKKDAHTKDFINDIKRKSKFRVSDKIEKYTKSKKNIRVRVKENGKDLLDKNGNPTFKYVTRKYPNYSLENLEYNVLKDTSQNPVDAVQYSKVLLKVFRHYIDAKDTYKESMRYRHLMLELQREICRINSDIKEEDLQMDF